jgi:hypothetical protein
MPPNSFEYPSLLDPALLGERFHYVGLNGRKQVVYFGRRLGKSEGEFVTSDSPKTEPLDLLESLQFRYAADAKWTSASGSQRLPSEMESTHIHNVLNKLRGMHETFVLMHAKRYATKDLSFEAVYPIVKSLEAELAKRAAPPVPNDVKALIQAMHDAFVDHNFIGTPKNGFPLNYMARGYRAPDLIIEVRAVTSPDMFVPALEALAYLGPRMARNKPLEVTLNGLEDRASGYARATACLSIIQKLVKQWNEAREKMQHYVVDGSGV